MDQHHHHPFAEPKRAGVAFEFPDYHKVGDSWEKLNYKNMAAVDAVVADGILQLASDAPAPVWTEEPATAKYIDAFKKLHPQQYQEYRRGMDTGHACGTTIVQRGKQANRQAGRPADKRLVSHAPGF